MQGGGSGAYTTPTEWKLTNQTKLSQAQLERLTAERLIAESQRLRDDVDSRVTSSRREVTQQFSSRIRDLQYWSSNLEQKINETNTEIESLTQCQAQLQRMYRSCADPVAVVEQCIQLREKRQGVDRCLDEVQNSLHEELRSLRQAESALSRTAQEALEQVRLLRSAKYQLEKDLSDKHKAAEIDHSAAGLADSCVANTPAPRLLSDLVNSSQVSGNVNFPWSSQAPELGSTSRNESAIAKANRQTSPSEWQAFSERNVQVASEQIHKSMQLRLNAQSLMQDIIRDTRSHATQVDQLFLDITERTHKALEAMNKEHDAVSQQIQHVEETASQLRNSIGAQDVPLSSTVQQLMRRGTRPNYELCRDSVQESLESRVGVVKSSLRQLQDKLIQTEASLRRLRQTKYELEQEIQVKQSTLRIDKEQCVNALRRNMILPSP